MRYTAKATPYSSIVGGGVSLVDESGRAAFQIVFMGTTSGISKEQSDELARQIEWYVNELGLELPTPTLKD